MRPDRPLTLSEFCFSQQRNPMLPFDSVYWPFVVLAISVIFIILAISKWRFHAFIALLLAALLTGILSVPKEFERKSIGPDGQEVVEVVTDRWVVVDKQGVKKEYSRWVGIVELIAKGLGDTARDIAISIGLASIIGMCLMESGGADKVVRRFLRVFGEKRAGWALLWSTYILSIPIFFDTMFMLMAPLAKALRLKTGKDYMLYVLCICCGGMLTHSLTIPHPGPIAMVDTLGIDIGFSILAGLVGGIIPAVLGYGLCVFMNARMDVPVRDTNIHADDVNKPESELPSFFWAILPVVLPIVLIGFSSLFKVIDDGARAPGPRQIPWCSSVIQTIGSSQFESAKSVVDFLGHKNIALFIGAGIALWVLAQQRRFGREKLERLVGPPLETAGMIILITSAGGAFGGMLREARVDEAVKHVAAGQSINLILLAFIVAAVIRIAQGSATVAMLTAASMMVQMLGSLDCNRIYIYLAIGFGAMSCSWMNDSGFWVVSRLSGMTQKETLKSWTVLSTWLAICGLAVTLAASKLLPLAETGASDRTPVAASGTVPLQRLAE